MASEFRFPRSQWTNAPMRLVVPLVSSHGSSYATEVSANIIRLASRAERYGEFGPDRRGTPQPSPIRRHMHAEVQAKRDEDLIAYAREGQEVRAEILSERLELAIDELLASRLQGHDHDLSAKREVLFDLYEREILTRDQVRDRGNLEPSAFYEELHAYRQRHAAQ